MNAMSVTKFAWEENQKQMREVERSYLEWVLKKNYSKKKKKQDSISSSEKTMSASLTECRFVVAYYTQA